MAHQHLRPLRQDHSCPMPCPAPSVCCLCSLSVLGICLSGMQVLTPKLPTLGLNPATADRLRCVIQFIALFALAALVSARRSSGAGSRLRIYMLESHSSTRLACRLWAAALVSGGGKANWKQRSGTCGAERHIATDELVLLFR